MPFQLALEDKSLFNFTKENCILHYFYKTHEHEEIIVEHKDLPVKKYYTLYDRCFRVTEEMFFLILIINLVNL